MAMNEFTRLCIDTANHKVQNYTAEDANTSIRNKFFDVMGVNKDTGRKELHRAIRRHAVEIYELVEDTLEILLRTGWGENPFFRAFVEERNIAVGDMNQFTIEDDSVLTVSKFSGNHHDLIRQKLGAGESFTIPLSWYGVKIYADFEQMLTGQIDWATFVQKIYTAMDNKINSMIYQAFMDADNFLPTEFVKTGDISKEDIVEMASEISSLTGKDVVIVGTRTALTKLYDKMDTAWVSDAMKEERRTSGVVGYVDGIQTMVIPQIYEPGTRNPLVDNARLMIVPVSPDFKPIKLVNGGDPYFNEVTDRETHMDMTIDAEYMQKLGVGVVMNMYYGLIKNIA